MRISREIYVLSICAAIMLADVPAIAVENHTDVRPDEAKWVWAESSDASDEATDTADADDSSEQDADGDDEPAVGHQPSDE